jgi:hypothetical protein
VIEPAVYTSQLLERRRPSGIDVTTTLRDFSIVTYAVPPERLTRHVAPRFSPQIIATPDGPRALISVVPFRDTAFRLAGWPTPRLVFGQTNYRAYVRDRESGERAVWFFGTALDSTTVAVPRHIWKLPWHRARIQFDCAYDARAKRYDRYVMQAKGAWGSAAVDLIDTGEPLQSLAGFPDLETAMVVLTQPLTGVFYRRDGALGTYSVWHDRLEPTLGSCRSARFDLLDQLGLVSFADQGAPYNVMIQPAVEFTIYLPPRRL